MTSPQRSTVRPVHQQQGLALLMLLLVLGLGALFFTVSGLGVLGTQLKRADSTARAMAQAKEALIGYAITYRDSHPNETVGYLPCPDTDGNGEAKGDCGGKGISAVGLLPYKTLGLADLRDESGTCLWYAVSGSHKNNIKADLLNWDTQGQFLIKNLQGVDLAKPQDEQGGVAAVIFAVGPPLVGQNRTSVSGACGIGPTTAQIPAFLDLPYVFPSVSGSTTTLVSGDSKSDTNNDRIMWITPKEIFDKLKKRSDWAGHINTLIANIKSKIDSSMPLPANRTDYTLHSVGDISVVLDAPYAELLTNWKDQFRYARCKTLNTYCLTINGQFCDGLLLFSGSDVTNNPRATSARNTTNYFENPSALNLVTTNARTFTGPENYVVTASSSDVGVCLSPQPLTSINSFSGFTATASNSSIVTPDGAGVGTVVFTSTASGASAATDIGCFWYPVPALFGQGIRLHFGFNFATKGAGFTFVLADADSARNPSTLMCGAADYYLGYAGNSGLSISGSPVLPINYPKIGVEFDTQRNVLERNDPPPFGAVGHAAYLYWGVGAGDPIGSDDNVHGAGGGSDPINPTTTPGLSRFNIATNRNQEVRIDFARTYNSATGKGSYTMTTYIANNPATNGYSSDCDSTKFADLTQNLDAQCSPSSSANLHIITQSNLTINDTAVGSEALKRVYVGFTNAQSQSFNQNLTLQNFTLQSY